MNSQEASLGYGAPDSDLRRLNQFACSLGAGPISIAQGLALDIGFTRLPVTSTTSGKPINPVRQRPLGRRAQSLAQSGLATNWQPNRAGIPPVNLRLQVSRSSPGELDAVQRYAR